MSEEQKDTLINRLAYTLNARPEIVLAYVHGSFTESAFHDLDIAVLLAHAQGTAQVSESSGPSFQVNHNLLEAGPGGKYDRLSHELDLERDLARLAGLPVDVRVLNAAPVTFRFRVIRTGMIFVCKDDDIRADFEFLTVTEYHDTEYLRCTYRREALGLEV